MRYEGAIRALCCITAGASFRSYEGDMKALLKRYFGAIKALFRRYEASMLYYSRREFNQRRRRYEGAIKALLWRYYGAITALLRLYGVLQQAHLHAVLLLRSPNMKALSRRNSGAITALLRERDLHAVLLSRSPLTHLCLQQLPWPL